MPEKLYTVKEAAADYFQGKVSGREINRLFHAGHLKGFRVGAKIILYESGLDDYRRGGENQQPPASPAEPISPPQPSVPAPRRRRREPVGPFRLKRLPGPS